VPVSQSGTQPNFTPAGAYIHVPFCSRRCGYCNFTLITKRDDLVEAYLNCLEIELEQTLGNPQSVQSIFLGGGTPTYLGPSHLESLLELISKWLKLEPDGEYSCEANPLDCTSDRLGILRNAGVNRLSLGGQSFENRKLLRLERDHTGRQLHQAIDAASRYFENLSLDLIFGVPDEDLETWQSDLVTALATPIRHLSTYGLTIEKGTQFFNRMLRGDLSELDSEIQLGMYHAAIDSIQEAGWRHYEVSNFAQPGFECRHNIGYWSGQCWWAFGPGAASCLAASCLAASAITNAPPGAGENHAASVQPDLKTGWVLATNHRSTTQYIKRIQTAQSPVAEREHLDLEQWIRQRLVFGLRQIDGVDLEELSARWGSPVETLLEPHLSRFLAEGWLQRAGNRLQLTRAGLVISDGLWPDLLVSQSAEAS
jgi:oxygen-independent coproporphyrinogen III oxidase